MRRCRFRKRQRPTVPDISVVLPSVLQSLAGGQSILTAPAEGPLTVGKLLETVTGDYPVLARRLRDETGALRRYVNIYVNGDEVRRLQGLETEVAAGQEVLVIQSVAGG
ncbi:MoaD/ThiS family protein [Pseudarthrobacter sulfonivorans]|jgi:molybdopterin synthase sulfur carrier subunit|uniref:MoaD/ThiS family protein n=1 Tax=Pseudarthrobacter sulfonivorans TaxID=121292 RepID=UPI00389A63F0